VGEKNPAHLRGMQKGPQKNSNKKCGGEKAEKGKPTGGPDDIQGQGGGMFWSSRRPIGGQKKKKKEMGGGDKLEKERRRGKGVDKHKKINESGSSKKQRVARSCQVGGGR